MSGEGRDLGSMRERVRAGGGPERIAKHAARGKLTARQRIDTLLDPGSFLELGEFVTPRVAEAPADGVITGSGRVDGRPVCVFAQDFTVLGGSVGEMHAQKICRVLDLALETRCPVIGLNDSGGARIQEGIDALKGYGEIFRRNSMASGIVPQLSVIMGPCAGGAVYSPALTDLVFMVAGGSHMFITGPDVIREVTREKVDFDTLGGGHTHGAISGVAHFLAGNEVDCLQLVRHLLSYLPSSCDSPPPMADPLEPEPVDMCQLLPERSKSYDVRLVTRGLLDAGYLLEVHSGWARNVVVGFGRLGGQVVGLIANQPAVLAGCLDIDASDKVARFVRMADAFNIPLLTLVDTPGYLPSQGQEHGGIIRHGAKVLYAYSKATVPRISLILRKAYGGAYIAMCSRSLGADMALAWPSAEIAVMGPEAASRIIYRKELEGATDPSALAGELAERYRAEHLNPFRAAARGHVDRIIEPADTRQELLAALAALGPMSHRRRSHGNIPL